METRKNNYLERGCFATLRSLKLWHKTVCLVVVLGVIILAYFVISWVVHQSSKKSPTLYKQNAQFESLIKGEYEANLFNGTWVSGTEFFYLDIHQNLLIYDCENGSNTMVINRTEKVIRPGSFNFKFSPNNKYLLYATDSRKVFRHSALAKYSILNLSTKNVTLLTNDELSLVKWAPQGQGLAFVKADHNIYYRSYPESGNDVQITFNGDGKSVFNGVPDWVYEEEILVSNEAMWFSNDGKKLAFITFNDTNVPVFTIPYYGQPGDIRYQYALQFSVHYPKVGHANPTVSIQVADLSQIEVEPKIEVTNNYLPPDSVGLEPIIASLTWANNSTFLLIWFNRYQNITSYCMCSTLNDACKEKFTYKEPNGWISPQVPRFHPSGESMVQIFPINEGIHDLYNQVVLFNFTQEIISPHYLTRGKITVSEIVQWDTTEDIVYFISTLEGMPEQLQTQFVSSKINNETHLGKYTCLSCDNYKTIDGNPCLYAGSMFSTDSSYYVISCSGPQVPEVTIFNKRHKPVILWETNDKVRETIKNTYFTRYKILDVPLENNFTAKVYLTYPEVTKDGKYPLLVRVYSGPDSSLVTEQFNINFDRYYASNRSIYTAVIDARGSGLKGSRNSFTLNRKLGTVEVEDQITVVKYLLNKYKHIDPDKVAVWGWSYGGYVTGMMLAKDTTNTVKCGIMVAPVTDWLLYDSMYTERYMGAPTEEDNADGYYNSSLSRHAFGLKDKMFFLIHGTQDDNVHYQNSMLLAKVLQQNDILFRQMTYTDEDHSLRFVYPHFYHSIQQFFDECFDKNERET
uniref:Venom dipeptidyl peptidase 4 n=1 Tax=Clastoptera arizonana TaxID=38151 RepID=A0A1B6DL67_9HEMI